MKHPLLQKRALDAQLEALNDSQSAITDPRTDKDYEHPFGSKGTELEIPARQGSAKTARVSPQQLQEWAKTIPNFFQDLHITPVEGALQLEFKGKPIGWLGLPLEQAMGLLEPFMQKGLNKSDEAIWDHILSPYGGQSAVFASKQASDPNIITQIWKYFKTHRVGKMEEIVAFTGLPEEQIRPVVEEMGDLGYLRKHRGDVWQMLVGGGKVGATWGLLNDLMGKDSPEEEAQKLIPYRTQQSHDVCPKCGGGLTRAYKDGGPETEMVCTKCKYAPKGDQVKHSAQMCEQCGERPAIFKSPSTGQYKSDRYHKVCLQCWRNTMESERAKALVPPKAVQRPGSEQFITRRQQASKTAAKNVPDNGQYDIEHESTIRAKARIWAQYAEPSDNTDEVKSFDPDGNYLCGTCTMRRGTDQCSRVDGPISFEKGSCRIFNSGNPGSDPDMKKKFTKAEVNYGTSNQGGFGCHRCEYGGEAKAPDAKGRESWCSFWGMHIVPKACCAEQELVEIQPKPKSRIEKLEARHEKGINEILRSAKAASKEYPHDFNAEGVCTKCGDGKRGRSDCPRAAKQAGSTKCPECGSTEYGLMPSDFETAKCDKCGKTWEIGLVKGVNAGAITTLYDPNRETCAVTRDIGGKMMKCIKDKGHRPPCHFGKMAREVMHDDSGATTGLRNKPDYGESTSHSSVMNRLNMIGKWKSPLLRIAVVDQAVKIHETPRMLPPRNDMREHLDEDTKKEIYDPLKVKREGRPVGGHTADDEAWESDLINQEEHFNDQVSDMQREARDAFMSDEDMVMEANHQGMTMGQLWQEMGNDFTNEYWQSHYGSKRASKLATCPKCSRSLAKEVTDRKNASVRVFECTACSHLFSL